DDVLRRMRVRGARFHAAVAVAAVVLVIAGAAFAFEIARSDAKVAETAPAAAPPTLSTTTTSFRFEGRVRSFLLVRTDPRPHVKLPVVVVLHGRGASPQLERTRTG